MARINSEDISRVWCVCTVYIHFGLLFYLPKWHFTTYHKTVDGHLCVGSFLLPPIFFLTFRKKKRNTFLKEFRAIFFYSLFSNSSFYFFIAPLFIPSFPEGFRSPLRDFFLKRFNSHLKKKTEIENSELVFFYFFILSFPPPLKKLKLERIHLIVIHTLNVVVIGLNHPPKNASYTTFLRIRSPTKKKTKLCHFIVRIVGVIIWIMTSL